MKKKITIIVTGACGFIGEALCVNLSEKYNVIGIDTLRNTFKSGYNHIVADIVDTSLIQKICETYKPSVVIHCAGITNQVFTKISRDTFFNVNSDATEKFAEIALEANPDTYFIFLSSISVYGEDNIKGTVSEENECKPSSDYACSKLDAEKRLIKIHEAGGLKKIDILRLGPVYDSERSLNIDRRVLAPKKMAYIKFGSGDQKLSAISRENIVDFIDYRLKQEGDNPTDKSFCKVFNVCDEQPYKFNEIINIFKQSGYHPDKLIVRVPLSLVWIATRLAGIILKNKRQWLYSCYDKLANDLVFDNSRMLATGFKPKHTLESVFLRGNNLT